MWKYIIMPQLWLDKQKDFSALTERNFILVSACFSATAWEVFKAIINLVYVAITSLVDDKLHPLVTFEDINWFFIFIFVLSLVVGHLQVSKNRRSKAVVDPAEKERK